MKCRTCGRYMVHYRKYGYVCTDCSLDDRNQIDRIEANQERLIEAAERLSNYDWTPTDDVNEALE